jgi:hypothetical protein
LAQPIPVQVEDGSELTRQAWDRLETEGKDLGLPDLQVQPIQDFLHVAEQHALSRADRESILDQATLIFDHLYPHMPFKTEIYEATHPSDFIRDQIRPNLDSMSEIDFHAKVIAAFSLVRDAHTLYGLPSPYRGAVAFLPFQIRPYLEQGAGWRFIVTSVMGTQSDSGFQYPFFVPGTEVVGWGDLTALDHVERVQEHLPGGNYFASLMRGSIHTTLRPLVFVQLPFADEMPAAIIHYRSRGSNDTRAISIPWAVGTGFGAKGGIPTSLFSSISPATAITTVCGKFLHHRADLREDRTNVQSQDPNQVSSIPEIFDFQYTGGPRKKGFIDLADLVDREKPDARFGYIRIKAFSDGSSAPGSSDRIVQEFQRIVTLMDRVAPDGLIIDIRSNPGGDVQAAERMLQMLTPQPIQPARFHLANTPAVLDILRGLKVSMTNRLSVSDSTKLAQALAELNAWFEDTEQVPLPAGDRLTSGQPLTDPGSANDVGQIYHGRGVALLINSLTYSAADIFAAGFQDHEGGVMLGTSMVTGGGGGNVWSHQDLLNKIGPSPGITLAELPGDASISLAIRRCSRVGSAEGQPVEDEGVSVNVFYSPNDLDDLITGNPGLIGRACQELRHHRDFRIDAGAPTLAADGSLKIEVHTTNIASLKFFLNGHLALTIAPDATTAQPISVPAVAEVASPSVLRIEGYAAGPAADNSLKLLRARTIRLQKAAPAETFDPATQSVTGTDPTITGADPASGPPSDSATSGSA